jgi:eukaryotic-like serine/threonine-protein kinase
VTDGVAPGAGLLAGRYQVGNLIGRGGMADVHIGTDSRLGRRVAIKLLRPALATDPAFRSRFRREAQDAAKMAHPTIVRIFDAGEETVRDSSGNEVQLPFIVMEYVDGRVLKDLIAQGPLEPSEAIRITEEVLTALEYSHRAGVVHRDIKPGNIMITTGGQVKVMDFGIARAVSESSANIAQTSTIMGTAQYFSPEQARGETVDARTDLYSTGIVLFEMLTGHPPFTGDNPVAVAYQHVNQPVPPPSSINPRVSPAIDAVVLRAVAKDRFERFQSATEFREAVVAAGSGTIPHRKSPDVNDFNATLFGVNPAVTAGAEATMRQLTAVDDERVTRTQSRPPVAWIWGGIAVIAVIIVAVMIWTLTITHTSFDSGLSVKVPDVKDQSWEDGSALLISKKLVPNRVDETSKDVAEGTILRTDPKAGVVVSPQEPIKVYVSSGPEKVSVPQIVGMTQAAAQAALEAKGLKLGDVSKAHSPSIPKDDVISLVPDANSKAAIGSSVDIVISDGIVTVPSVVGQAVGDATSLLSGPSVKLDVVTQADSGCSGGLVSSQSIVGDQPQGSTITIIYCGAPN